MTDPANTNRSLLPEEQRAGSDDAEHQAEVILDDSEHRTDDPEQARRESSQTPDPGNV